MIKILFFIPGLSEGGAEKVLRNLVNNMDQSKFDITVQTINEYEADKYLAKGIKYKSIITCKSYVGKKMMQYWFRFCTALKLTYPLYVKGDYDIEVAYLECGATKVMSASTNKKALKLAWVHCDLNKKGIVSDKTKRQYKRFDKVICVSDDTKKVFDSCFDNCTESVVLHNVIDEEEIFEKAENKLRFARDNTAKNLIAVGRLAKQKAFDHLIKTCAKLRDDGYKFFLRILGEGPERENLSQLINNLKLTNHVELCGFVDNPYPYMKAADFIICSSKYEGFSTVVIEALILGKPVITTPCTGMYELLGNSKYGFIVDDSEDGLYKGLKQMIDSPEVENRYITMAKKRGADFSKRKLTLQTEKFFEAELKKKSAIDR